MTVADGPAALGALSAALADHPFDAILLDWRLAGMDGPAVARAIASEPCLRGLPLIVLAEPGRAGGLDAAAYQPAVVLARLTRPSQLKASLCRLLGGAAAARPAATGALAAAPTPRPGARLLLAEDNVTNQKVAVLLLERLGCRVDIAANGVEALAALERATYDLVLMDCHMPELDGFDTTRLIRQREAGGRHLPIIAMTANALAGDRERCLAAGMDDYLAKPVSQAALASTLGRWLPTTPTAAPAAPAPGADGEAPVPAAPAPGVDEEAAAAVVAVFDRAIVDELRGSDPDGDEFIREVVTLFLTETPSRLAAIWTAIERDEPGALHRAAHALAGSCASLGAIELRGLSRDLDQIGRAGTTAGARALALEVEAAFARLEPILVAEGRGAAHRASNVA